MLSDMHLHEYAFFIYYNSEKNPWGNKKWLNPHCSLLLQSADHHFRQWSWLLICKICCLCYRSQSKVLITAHFRDHCKTGVYISQYIDIRMLYSLISVLAPKKKYWSSSTLKNLHTPSAFHLFYWIIHVVTVLENYFYASYYTLCISWPLSTKGCSMLQCLNWCEDCWIHFVHFTNSHSFQICQFSVKIDLQSFGREFFITVKIKCFTLYCCQLTYISRNYFQLMLPFQMQIFETLD